VSEDALGFGQATGSLPAPRLMFCPASEAVAFRNQVAAGASYTTALPKITFNVESSTARRDSQARLDQWFRAGSANGRPCPDRRRTLVRAASMRRTSRT